MFYRGIATLNSGGQEEHFLSFSLILLLFMPIFLNFSSVSSSIWSCRWANFPPGKALATPLVIEVNILSSTRKTPSKHRKVLLGFKIMMPNLNASSFWIKKKQTSKQTNKHKKKRPSKKLCFYFKSQNALQLVWGRKKKCCVVFPRPTQSFEKFRLLFFFSQ